MQLFIIIAIIVIVLVLAGVLVKRRNAHTSQQSEVANYPISSASATNALPTEIDEMTLGYFQEVELSDSFELDAYTSLKNSGTVLSTISHLIPISANLTTAVSSKAASGVLSGAYQVILKPGHELMNSKTPGRLRAITKMVGHNGIAGQAELQKIQGTATELATKTGAVASVMAIGSMVVGQYYITEISGKLDGISSSIESIKNFQNTELLANVRSVIRETRHIATYRNEIIESESERLDSREHIRELEEKAGKLLDQVNGLISSNLVEIQKFDEYERRVGEIDSLMSAQKALLIILRELARLVVVLSNAEVSSDRANATYTELSQNADTVNTKLQQWHSKIIDRFQVDLQSARRPKTGMQKVVSTPVSIFKQGFAFLTIPEATIQKIYAETKAKQIELPETVGYQQPVELLIKGEQVYYRAPAVSSTYEDEKVGI